MSPLSTKNNSSLGKTEGNHGMYLLLLLIPRKVNCIATPIPSLASIFTKKNILRYIWSISSQVTSDLFCNNDVFFEFPNMKKQEPPYDILFNAIKVSIMFLFFLFVRVNKVNLLEKPTVQVYSKIECSFT